MARVVVLNLPEYGHMNATYPVVAELARRGEEIIYYSTEPFRANIAAAGAKFAGYGDAELFIPPAHTGGLHSVMAWEMGLAEHLLPRLVEEVRNARPDYLLIDSMCVWGNLLRQVLQLPAVCMASVFVPNDRFVTVEDMVRIAYSQAPKPVLLAGIDAMNTYIETSRRIDHRFGTLSPNVVEFFSNRQQLNLLFTSREFHPEGNSFGPEYKFAGPMLDFQRQDIPTEDAIPSSGDVPLVYVSLGTIFNNQPEFFRACIKAYADVPYRVWIAAGRKVDLAAFGQLPSNIAMREYVPQLAVLKQAALFITHGGMNSVSEALAHGVPLLVFPQHGDQHLVAAQVERAGAGIRLTPPDITPQRLRDLAETVLREQHFADAAKAVQESFAQCGGAGAAADAVLEFAASTVETKAGSRA